MKVVLVTGGRAYPDGIRVREVLNEELPDLIIHGAAKRWDPEHGCTVGADYFASRWATDADVAQLMAPYRSALGPSGGPIRNSWMIDRLADFAARGHECKVVAFPGGAGTADTVRKARPTFTVREVEA